MISKLFNSKKELARLNTLDEEKTKDIGEKDLLIEEFKMREECLLAIKSAMEGSSAAVMMIDREFIVTYVNQASIDLFKSNTKEFKSAFPNFDPSKILGTCIDVFHKKPEHQRQMLSDPSRLPFKTDIKVGNLTIALYVTATYCQSGNHTGNVLEWRDVTEARRKAVLDLDYVGQMEAIRKNQGVIELDLDGRIIASNEVYQQMLGYSAEELTGKHVSMVLDPAFAKSPEYSMLWQKLVQGGSDAGQYKRIAKGGKDVWIQAYYSPILDNKGKPFKIVNYTTNITEQKLKAADDAGQIAAINKIQGVIEFDLTGKITAVNTNFSKVTGYSEKEIVGNHHSMFVEQTFRSSPEYKSFWEKLGSGTADSGQYKRIGKGGKEVWLQASYNPIFDLSGKPFKVVKYATDITEQYNNAKTLATAVEETQAIIEGAKTGDLSSRIPLEGKTGAIASLCEGVNILMDKMAEVILQVREAGETINTAASEIATGNNDLSSRTEQQASSLQETAASMEELASTVKQNTENAKQANQLAATASEVAMRGGNVVNQVITTMTDINDSSRKIEDIISVIDGIAFQTNILALNAAVEAARAGEQGRGFAVVAGEVRNLAQRSAGAAKEIKQLISDSVSKVVAGTQLVEEAGLTMEEIMQSVQRVTDIMGEIAEASVEQSSGIAQVNQAVTQMDEVTQQNAALVEQAAAAAESLVEQANSLMEAVNTFKLKDIDPRLEKRSTNSTMRKPSSAPKQQLKPGSKSATVRPIKSAKNLSVNDNGDWEQF